MSKYAVLAQMFLFYVYLVTIYNNYSMYGDTMLNLQMFGTNCWELRRASATLNSVKRFLFVSFSRHFANCPNQCG